MFGMYAFGQPYFADGPGGTPVPPITGLAGDETIHLGTKENLGVKTLDTTIGGW